MPTFRMIALLLLIHVVAAKLWIPDPMSGSGESLHGAALIALGAAPSFGETRGALDEASEMSAFGVRLPGDMADEIANLSEHPAPRGRGAGHREASGAPLLGLSTAAASSSCGDEPASSSPLAQAAALALSLLVVTLMLAWTVVFIFDAYACLGGRPAPAGGVGRLRPLASLGESLIVCSSLLMVCGGSARGLILMAAMVSSRLLCKEVVPGCLSAGLRAPDLSQASESPPAPSQTGPLFHSKGSAVADWQSDVVAAKPAENANRLSDDATHKAELVLRRRTKSCGVVV